MKWCLYIAAGFLSGAVGVVFIKRFPSSSQDWAAWIQAFGSIAAIIAGAIALRVQRKHQIDDAKTTRFRLESAAASYLLINAFEIARSLRSLSIYTAELSEERPYQFNPRRLEDNLLSLRQIPISDLPSALYRDVLILQRLLISAVRTVERRQGKFMAGNERMRNAASQRSASAKAVHRRVKAFVELLAGAEVEDGIVEDLQNE